MKAKSKKKATQGAKAGSKADPLKKKKATPKAKTKPKGKTSTKAKTKTSKKKAERTHILAIIDRSGSMGSVRKDAIGGFNTFLAAQKKLKDPATMNVVLFSNYDKITPLYNGEILDVKDVAELTELTYVPEGSTALHDAMVQSMSNLKLKINDMKPSKKPAKVLVLIITDGEENDSREYPKTKIDEVKKLVELRKKENWQFIFMCSTEDTALTGEALGFSKGNVFQYTNDSVGNQAMFSAVATASTLYRSTSVKSRSFAKVSNNLLAEDQVDDQPDTQTVLDADSDVA
jgi:uncharacterized protein YegL